MAEAGTVFGLVSVLCAMRLGGYVLSETLMLLGGNYGASRASTLPMATLGK